jgi:hypothetical protein
MPTNERASRNVHRFHCGVQLQNSPILARDKSAHFPIPDLSRLNHRLSSYRLVGDNIRQCISRTVPSILQGTHHSIKPSLNSPMSRCYAEGQREQRDEAFFELYRALTPNRGTARQVKRTEVCEVCSRFSLPLSLFLSLSLSLSLSLCLSLSLSGV